MSFPQSSDTHGDQRRTHGKALFRLAAPFESEAKADKPLGERASQHVDRWTASRPFDARRPGGRG